MRVCAPANPAYDVPDPQDILNILDIGLLFLVLAPLADIPAQKWPPRLKQLPKTDLHGSLNRNVRPYRPVT